MHRYGMSKASRCGSREMRMFPFHMSAMEEYPYARACSGNITVARWRRNRFTKNFPGVAIEVLHRGGRPPASGQMLVKNLRSHWAPIIRDFPGA